MPAIAAASSAALTAAFGWSMLTSGNVSETMSDAVPIVVAGGMLLSISESWWCRPRQAATTDASAASPMHQPCGSAQR